MGVGIIFGHELGGSPGRSNNLSASTALQFNIVNERSQRDIPQRQGVAGLNIGISARNHGISYFDFIRRQNVGFFSIRIAEQSDSRGPIGVVLYGFYDSGNSDFSPFEIDNPVTAFMSTAPMPTSDTTGVVATTLFIQRRQKLFLGLVFRNLGKIRDAHIASSR
jgi:hypothetical protein